MRFALLTTVLVVALASLACGPRGSGREEALGKSAITREPEGSWEAVGSLKDIRNVVLISIDALGAKHTGAYGYTRETTPNLDRFAAEGAMFVYAYAQQMHTLASHLTMMTGLYPQAHGASESRVASARATTLAEILKEHGFTTAAFTGKVGFAGPRFGLGRGIDLYRTGSGNAEEENGPRFRWLEEQARAHAADPEHRFFLFAHFYDVHSDFKTDVPYFAPPPYDLMFLPGGLNWKHRGDSALLQELYKSGKVTPEDRRILTALYDGGVRYCDEKGVGPLLEKLRELKFDDDTLVIITSDHGEEIFEHGESIHQQPYEETSRVPLVFKGPGIPRGLRLPYLAELVDLMPTVLSLLSLPIPDHVQGDDLKPLFFGERPGEQIARVDGIRKDSHTFKSNLIVELDGRRWSYLNRVAREPEAEGGGFRLKNRGELYDLDRDPEQMINLVKKRREVAGKLAEDLLSWYAETDALAQRLGVSEKGTVVISEEEKQRLRGLGYVQ
jgi:arylsulfatase A-like enzyme